MITTQDPAERLLHAFKWNDRDWHTAREVSHALENSNEKLPFAELLNVAEFLAEQGYLDVVFTSPENGTRTGFSARLTVAGREHLRKRDA